MGSVGPMRSGAAPCRGCGFERERLEVAILPAAILAVVSDWGSLVHSVASQGGGIELLARRPEPGVWSAVEYAGHVRDFLSAASDHVARMRAGRRYEMSPWDPRALVEGGNYRSICARSLVADMDFAARDLVRQLIDDASPPGRLGSGSGSPHAKARGMAALHEAVHHLADARSALSAEG